MTQTEVFSETATDVRAREMDKALILPFFDKEPYWSKFSAYQFKDGRKVYEIHLKNLSGIMPKEFFERIGSSGNDLIEESLLFVTKANGEDGYSVLIARYYSYGEKSEGMTYHKIPSNKSCRIDMFSYGEEHLRSFEVENGKILSHIKYQMEEDIKKTGEFNYNMYWVLD